MASTNYLNRQEVGTGPACSFTPSHYFLSCEIEVINVKKLLSSIHLPAATGSRFIYLWEQIRHSPVGGGGGTKIASLNSIGGVHDE